MRDSQKTLSQTAAGDGASAAYDGDGASAAYDGDGAGAAYDGHGGGAADEQDSTRSMNDCRLSCLYRCVQWSMV